jgi:hypothetical protein
MRAARRSKMSAADLTAGVQFTVDQAGQVTAVVIDPALWRRIVVALEDTEDRALVVALRQRLAEGPAAGGALKWQDVAGDWR